MLALPRGSLVMCGVAMTESLSSRSRSRRYCTVGEYRTYPYFVVRYRLDGWHHRHYIMVWWPPLPARLTPAASLNLTSEAPAAAQRVRPT